MSALSIQTGCRILVLASLGLASSTAIADAKVIWNDSVSLGGFGRDGICHASRLDRAERLAWRQTLILQRPGYLFGPSLITPSGLWVPFVQPGLSWSNRPLGIFEPFCDR